jgi:tetratricopeptide (TPR) repeat protein
MAYFRLRGNSITLLHGFRQDFGVRQKRLRTFSGPEDLRAALAPESWARLQIEVEQRHPECALNWGEVRTQAEKLLHHLSPDVPETWEDRLDAVARPARALARALQRLRPEEVDLVRQAVGPSVAQIVKFYCAPYEELAHLMKHFLPDPERADASVDQGIAAFHKGAVAKARKFFEAGRANHPFDPDVDNSEGICWFERGDDAEAERCFLSARQMAYNQLPNRERSYSWSDLRVRPYIRATYNLALLRDRQGRHEEAFEGMQECLRRCPNDGIGARFHLGTLLLRLGRLEESLPHFREALTGNLVDIPDPCFDGATVLFRLERVEEAISWLLQGIAMNPYIPEYLAKPPKRASQETSVESKGWAQKYVVTQRSYWSEEALKLLASVVNHSRVRLLTRGLLSNRAQLEHIPAGPERSNLVEQQSQIQSALRDAKLAREVYLFLGAGHPAAPSSGSKRTGPRAS